MKSLLFVIFAAALGPSQPRLDPSRAQTDAAEHMLQIADAEAGNLSGLDRAYAYWLISQAFAKINSKHEPEVLVKSCNAALAAEPAGADPMFRQKIRTCECLRGLSLPARCCGFPAIPLLFTSATSKIETLACLCFPSSQPPIRDKDQVATKSPPFRAVTLSQRG